MMREAADMKCPQCGAETNKGQNFCGDCGRELNIICSGCSNSNPPSYKFCGQCGQNLIDVGTLLLDRTGLILDADDTALALLIPQSGTALGKPFSLFVNTGDLALFFSHWNELLRSTHSQTVELELNSARDDIIHAQLVLTHMSNREDKSEQIHIQVNDITKHRQSNQDHEETDALLDCIEFMTDMFHPSNSEISEENIDGALKKICLLSAGQYAFIARIDKANKQVVTEFNWHESARLEKEEGTAAIALDHVRPILHKLEKGQPYVASDICSLKLPERQIWQTWHHQHGGAVHCEMVYHNKKPVGIIGVTKVKPGLWPHITILLIKLAGNLMAETLPRTPVKNSSTQLSPPTVNPSPPEVTHDQIAEINDFNEVEVMIEEEAEKDGGRELQMAVIADAHNGPGGSIPLFAIDGGEYRLTCPECSRQETLTTSLFEETGSILKVSCPCEHTFRVIREMRHTYRKDVQLEGLFTQDTSDVNKLAVSGGWSAMEVTNISKQGLNFTTPNARILNIGDQVQLQFNLDNNKKSLIKKPAEIKSVRKNNVGCQFLGSDKQDVTLGFYFI